MGQYYKVSYFVTDDAVQKFLVDLIQENRHYINQKYNLICLMAKKARNKI